MWLSEPKYFYFCKRLEYVSSVDNYLIILDASSSMDDTYNGNKKFTVAREIVKRLGQTLPELGQNAGLRSFGHNQQVSDGQHWRQSI